MPKLEIPNSNRVDWRDWKTYCVLPFVLFFYGQWEAIKSLRNKVYDISGWSGGFFFELFALAAAAGAAVTAAEAPPVPYFGWLHSFGQGVVGSTSPMRSSFRLSGSRYCDPPGRA